MNHAIHTKLGEDRRIALPAKLCSRLGVEAGDYFLVEEQEGSVRLVPMPQVLREVQEAFASCARGEGSVVDELIAERRAEAACEDA